MWRQEIEEKYLSLIPKDERKHAVYILSLLEDIDQNLKNMKCQGLTFFHVVTLYKHLANLCTRTLVDELPEDVFGDVSKDYPRAYQIACDTLRKMDINFPGVDHKGERQHLTIIISDLI